MRAIMQYIIAMFGQYKEGKITLLHYVSLGYGTKVPDELKFEMKICDNRLVL